LAGVVATGKSGGSPSKVGYQGRNPALAGINFNPTLSNPHKFYFKNPTNSYIYRSNPHRSKGGTITLLPYGFGET